MDILKLLLYMGSVIIALQIHELGHLVVALVYGCNFRLMSLGPLRIEKNLKGKLKLCFEKNIYNWGGSCLASPMNDQVIDYKVLRNILIGGPATSFILGIIMLIIHILLRHNHIGMYKDLTFVFGCVNLAIFVVCLIPSYQEIETSDGGRALRIMKGGHIRKTEIAIWKITSAIADGGYYNVDLDDIKILKNDINNNYVYLGYYYTYNYYKSINDTQKANIELDKIKTIESMVSKKTIMNYKIER